VPRLVKSQSRTRQQLLLTLLFMNVAQVQRPWDLRFYSGDGLALLSGRKRAYGYAHTERFLSQIAQSGTAEPLTDSLARWSSQLWRVEEVLCYLDGHKKPVYSDSLLPRGLVGRLDKILGCRALTLLMDASGHPLLVETARGDQHLTIGAPTLIERYERAAGKGKLATIIIDREGMSAEFLKALSEARTVITLLRSNQYKGLDSFSHVGEFVPLLVDRDGKVVREVAPAQFALSIPEQSGESLLLSVALIRDWRKSIALPPSDEYGPLEWDADLSYEMKRQWFEGQLEASAAPLGPAQPKLIPVVSTASTMTTLDLALHDRQRWVAQENIIRDFLLPLGLDINHGYAKKEVENSEVAKRRAKLKAQLENARKRATKAHRQMRWNSKRHVRLETQTKEHAKAQESAIWQLRHDLRVQGCPDEQREVIIKQAYDELNADLRQRHQQVYRCIDRCNAAYEKYEHSTVQQRELLRDLDTLDQQERTMYELDNTKDHIMSVLKLMLVNLLMWTRDHLFPSDYAHATTKTLLRLPGRVLTFDDRVLVTLRPFNDRALNCDLAEFCQRVNDAHLALPTGKMLIFRMAELACPTSNVPP